MMISHNFNSMEAWPPVVILLDDFSQLQTPWRQSSNPLATSTPTLFPTIIMQTSNPALFQSSRSLPILSQSHKNFLRKLLKSSNPPLLVTQSYENFLRKLPILHFWLTSQNFQTSTLFQSSTFGYAILRKL